MIKRAFFWLSATLPPYGLAIFFIGLALCWVLEWAFMGTLYLLYGAIPDDWNQLLGFRGWTVVALLGWGAWRASAINPAYAYPYRRWLETTPWSPDRPLPLGPVHLLWRDGLLLAAAALICWHSSLSWYAPLGFLLSYSFFQTQVNFRTGQDWHALAGIALAALLPLAFSYPESPWISLLLATSIAVISSLGWRRSLTSFPWEHLPRWKDFSVIRSAPPIERPTCKWWPLVHPAASFEIGPAVTWREALMTACLWGWLAGVIVFTIEDVGRRTPVPAEGVKLYVQNVAWLVSIAIGASASILRMLRYLSWCLPPISLLGRIATRRWIIPGYDRVFVAPAVAMLLAVALPRLLIAVNVSAAAAAFLATAAAVFAAIGIGPTLINWGLTGNYLMAKHRPTRRNRERRTSIELTKTG